MLVKKFPSPEPSHALIYKCCQLSLFSLQLAILLPNHLHKAIPSPPRVMEPAAMTLLLLLLLQLLRSLMVVSLPIQPRLLTLDMANKPLPLHHRRMCLLIHLACVFALGKISYTWSTILYLVS